MSILDQKKCPILIHLGQIRIFSKNRAPSLSSIYNFLYLSQISEIFIVWLLRKVCYRRFGFVLGYFRPTWQVQKSPKNAKNLYNSFKLSKQDIMGNGTTFNKWFAVSRVWAQFWAPKCPILYKQQFSQITHL